MSDGLGNFTKNRSQTNVSTKNGTGPNENDIRAQWNQDYQARMHLTIYYQGLI